MTAPREGLPNTVYATDIPMYLSEAVAVFRGRSIGVYRDW